MQKGDFETGSIVRLLIPEPVWREWKINGVDADSSAEVQAEHGEAVGYEFYWGQIIEEVIDGDPAAAPCDPEDLPGVALCWHFVLCGVHGEFLDGGGNLGELSDLAVAILADIEDSRDELPEAAREDGLPDLHFLRRRQQYQCLRDLRLGAIQHSPCPRMGGQLLHSRRAAASHRPSS